MALNIAKMDVTLWLQEHQQKISWALSIALVPFMLLFYFSAKKSKSSKEDYFQADAAYEKWSLSPSSEQETFEKLEKLMDRHPNLYKKFGSLIAEKCLVMNEPLLAAKFGGAALKQMEKVAPYHQLFSKTALCIAEGHYEQALNEAIGLKQQMEKGLQDPILFIFNMMRIASLERELGLFQKEALTLNEVKSYLQSSECPKEAQEMFATVFSDQSLSFIDYLNFRESSNREIRSGS